MLTAVRTADIVNDMRTISLSVSESDYEAFRRASKQKHQPIAQLIRDAMAVYRQERLEARSPLREVALLPGHRLVGTLPTREEVWEEIVAPRAEYLSR
jgi:hypothetical protein